jgi:hypothetical protein
MSDEILDAVNAAAERFSEMSKDPEKIAQATALAATAALWARKLTQKSQLTRGGTAAIVLTPAIIGALSSCAEVVVARGARPVTADETPTWHTYNHVRLLRNEHDSSKEPKANLIGPMAHYAMVVNEAFLNADTETQKTVFNTALDNDSTDRIASASLNTVAALSTLAQRRLFVGDREKLSAGRAAALSVTTTANSLVMGQVNKALMKNIREKHLRAGASQR